MLKNDMSVSKHEITPVSSVDNKLLQINKIR